MFQSFFKKSLNNLKNVNISLIQQSHSIKIESKNLKNLKKVKTVKLKLKADDGHLNIKSQSIVKWLNKDLSSEVIIGDKRHFDEAKAVKMGTYIQNKVKELAEPEEYDFKTKLSKLPNLVKISFNPVSTKNKKLE